jgi:hypothetical protein
LQRIYTSRYNINSGTTQAAITVIETCRAPLPHTFTVVSTLTDHSKTKCLLTLKSRFCFLKSEGSLNKKKYPSEQEETISCRLIPLLTHVSFRCAVSLMRFIVAGLVNVAAATNFYGSGVPQAATTSATIVLYVIMMKFY